VRETEREFAEAFMQTYAGIKADGVGGIFGRKNALNGHLQRT
jgi:hypothetical protein